MSHYYTPLGDKIHHGGYNPLGEVGGLKSTGGYTINNFIKSVLGIDFLLR